MTNYAASPCNMILSVAAQLCHEHLLSTRLPGHGAVARVSWRSAVAGKGTVVPVEAGDVDDVVKIEISNLRKRVGTPTPL